jgi:hypothetical protein
LLQSLDEKLGFSLSGLTSSLWSLHLMRTPASVPVKLGSLGVIYLAQTFLGEALRSNRGIVMYLYGIVEAAAVQRLLLKKQFTETLVPFMVYLIARTALFAWLCRKVNARQATGEGDFFTRNTKKLNALIGVAYFFAATGPKPLESTVLPLGLFGWALSLLTNQPSLFYLSCGFSASLSQGVAHRMAGELGTLEQLQLDPLNTATYELSHCTFFPNILLQACQEHLAAQLASRPGQLR